MSNTKDKFTLAPKNNPQVYEFNVLTPAMREARNMEIWGDCLVAFAEIRAAHERFKRSAENSASGEHARRELEAVLWRNAALLSKIE